MEGKKNIVLPIDNPLTDKYFDESEETNNHYEDWLGSQKLKYKFKGSKVIVYLNTV